MLELRARISQIENLLQSRSEADLTYAALECRLALELACYDRLRNSHGHISFKDISRWQPAAVVKQLIVDVEPLVATPLKFSISKESVDPDQKPEDMADDDYVLIGTQSGFDAKTIGKLWNVASKFLHVNVPRSKSDGVTPYAEPELLRRKIEEILTELKKIASGNLVLSGVGDVVGFTCDCGAEIVRRSDLLSDGQTISCINADCERTWKVIFSGSEIDFEEKTIAVTCTECKEVSYCPENSILNMPRTAAASFECLKCGHRDTYEWRICLANAK